MMQNRGRMKMKCPYRKITIEKIDSTGAKVWKEEFGDCYGHECPCYKRHISGYFICSKAFNEDKQKQR